MNKASKLWVGRPGSQDWALLDNLLLAHLHESHCLPSLVDVVLNDLAIHAEVDRHPLHFGCKVCAYLDLLPHDLHELVINQRALLIKPTRGIWVDVFLRRRLSRRGDIDGHELVCKPQVTLKLLDLSKAKDLPRTKRLKVKAAHN